MITFVLAASLAAATVTPAPASLPPSSMAADSSCHAATGDGAAAVRRAADVVGLTGAGDRVLRITSYDVTSHAYESDRMYPPFLHEVESAERWLDARGVQRADTHGTLGGYTFSLSWVADGRAAYVVRDTGLVASDQVFSALYATRPLDVWAALADWLAAPDARVTGRCVYRDYPRLVLTRGTPQGPERLFLDEKTGYPVKLDRVVPNYLWGQVHQEFVWMTWQRVGDVSLPGGAARVDDGVTAVTRTFGARRLVARDSAPSLALPPRAEAMAVTLPMFLQPTRPDTVRVSATTFVLRNPGYAETVTLARDTIVVFDATQGDERVRQDADWMAALFPGRHPIVVVVTDLAWPHVSGVRAWVARGATIVSHASSRAFLQQVIDRKWTLAPDTLERLRATRRVPFRFRGVREATPLAGGDLLAFPIDGIASEGALAVFVRPDRFLWGSDYIQSLRTPTQYVEEVVAAVRRAGLSPVKVGAEHLPVTDWSKVAALVENGAAP